MMREETNYKLSYQNEDDINALAMHLHCTRIAEYVQDFIALELLKSDDKYLYAPRLIENMHAMDEIRKQKSRAAKIRWKNNKNNKISPMHMHMQKPSAAMLVEKSIEENTRVEKRIHNKEQTLTLVDFPEPLKTQECLAAWSDWLEHKRSIGKRYKSTKAQSMQLSRLSALGPDKFVRAIRYSIGQNWQGVFEEPIQTNGFNKPDPNINRPSPKVYIPPPVPERNPDLVARNKELLKETLGKMQGVAMHK